MKIKQIEKKQIEILHIAQIRERNGERKMSEDEKWLLKHLENKQRGP